MTPPNPIDNKLTALRMLLAAGLVVASAAAGVVIFSATRLGGPILPDPVVAYAAAAVTGLALVGVVAFGSRLGAVAGRAAEPGYGAFAAAAVARVALLLVPGAIAVGGFFLTQKLVALAPLPAVYVAFVALRPTRRGFEAWPVADRPTAPESVSVNGRYRHDG